MKRRFYALMLVVAMLAMTLVGCGSDTSNTTNTTNDVTVNTEVEESGDDVIVESTEDPVATPEVDEPVVEAEPAPDGNDNGENVTINYKYAYDFIFPEGMNGFTKKYLNEDYPEWSLNKTHYVDINGNEMNFEWAGPAMLGENAGTGGKTLFLRSNGDDFELRAWNSGYSDGDYERCVNLPKETLISFAGKNIPYEENGYYNVEITDNSIIVTFKVSGNGYEGYNYYVLDGNNKVNYQFAYFEKSEIYDDARAMSVINSIKYWNYIP